MPEHGQAQGELTAHQAARQEEALHEQAMTAAREIAGEMIAAARNSGDDPIAWVTGNAYMPPLRSFAAAEEVWQASSGELMDDPWDALTCELERLLDEANVSMNCPEYDNALYVVDLARFEYAESDGSETLQDDWKPIGSDRAE